MNTQKQSIAATLVGSFLSTENTRRESLVTAACLIQNTAQRETVLQECIKLLGTHNRAKVYSAEWNIVFKAAVQLGGEAKKQLSERKSYFALIEFARSVTSKKRANSGKAVTTKGGSVTAKQLDTVLEKATVANVDQSKAIMDKAANNLAARPNGDRILADEIVRLALLVAKSADKGMAKWAQRIVDSASILEPKQNAEKKIPKAIETKTLPVPPIPAAIVAQMQGAPVTQTAA